MNYPQRNLTDLRALRDLATWHDIPSTANAAQQALKMEAALRLVLLFHSPEPWTSSRQLAWTNAQVEAGVEFPRDEATTRVLCDTIRAVLGESEEPVRCA